jgi:hypothetical protein
MYDSQDGLSGTGSRSWGQRLLIVFGLLIERFRTQQALRGFVVSSVVLLLVALALRLVPVARPAAALSGPPLLISEFMASNEHTLLDQDGEPSDWIEIHNRDTRPVDLGGWFLTDEDNDLAKWQFPPTVLPSQGYLIVFASGKDRATTGSELHTNFRLDSDGEYLALVEPDGLTVAWEYAPPVEEVTFNRLGGVFRRRQITPDYASQFGDISRGVDGNWNRRYFTQPTPGEDNSVAEADRGPTLSAIQHAPSYPAPGEDIVITASVTGAAAPIDQVLVHYRVMYGDTVDLVMADDGAHGDGKARDGIYGAVIPGSVPKAGEMVRYSITAWDANGGKSRRPFFHDPLHSPRYYGTMVADPGVSSELPVLYWFIDDPEEARDRFGTRAELFYVRPGQSEGLFYDNVFVRRRGQSSQTGWPKKSFKFEFNWGYYFQFAPDLAPVEEFNLNNTYSDKAYIRQVLSYEAYRDAGVPSSSCFPVRVQQNGQFHSVALFVEQPDDQYMARHGLDADGALYKMNNRLNFAYERVAKRERKEEDHRDLEALIDGLHLSGQARTAYLFDHVNLPAVINYLAVTTLIHDADCADKNYYLYRDTEGTGEWMFLPWDKDLTFGRNFHGHVLQDQITADRDPLSSPFNLDANLLIDAVYDTPSLREMYLRRLRTVMDEQLEPPGTPAPQLALERRIDELYQRMQADVALDAPKWPVEWGAPQSFAQALDVLKTDYLSARRVYLYGTYGPEGKGVIPPAQPATATVQFGDIGFVSLEEDADSEYLTLVNRNPYAVDLSDWSLEGAVHYTVQPGVVLPAGGALYVAADVVAFRRRAASPTGGEGRFVQGAYEGRVSGGWGVLRLYSAEGNLVACKAFFDLRPLGAPRTVTLL